MPYTAINLALGKKYSTDFALKLSKEKIKYALDINNFILGVFLDFLRPLTL